MRVASGIAALAMMAALNGSGEGAAPSELPIPEGIGYDARKAAYPRGRNSTYHYPRKHTEKRRAKQKAQRQARKRQRR